MAIYYRGFTIRHNPKPIPIRTEDYDFVHDDYDGAPDANDNRCGTAASVEDAKKEIDELLLDNELVLE